MLDETLKQSFAMDITLMNYIGLNPVVVHGGGPQIEEMLKKLGKTSRFVDGLRVTDPEIMDVVEMVLVGKINKEIVSLINCQGGKAVGLSGKDGNLITAKKLKLITRSASGKSSRARDIGLVGEVQAVNPLVLRYPGPQQVHTHHRPHRRRGRRQFLQYQRRYRGGQNRLRPQGGKADAAHRHRRGAG